MPSRMCPTCQVAWTDLDRCWNCGDPHFTASDVAVYGGVTTNVHAMHRLPGDPGPDPVIGAGPYAELAHAV